MAKGNEHLDSLTKQMKVLKDRVRGIVCGQANGMYLCGRPGTSKTYTVKTTLDNLGVKFYYHSGHLTPIGLFDLLGEFRDRVIVLDDVSSIFQEKVAVQLLLAALGNPHDGSRTRVVKYKRSSRETVVEFTGGIIAISNLPLDGHKNEVLRALADRVNVIDYDPSDEQILALCEDIASKGVGKHTPKECLMVLEFLKAEMASRASTGVRPSVRLFMDKAMKDYGLWKDQNSESHWHDLIISNLEQQLVDLTNPINDTVPRKEQIEAERRIVSDICLSYESPKDRVRVWKERTGKSQPAFYRRMKELKIAGSV